MPIHDTGPTSTQFKPPRSTCKICWRSIYMADLTDWAVRPNPGLVHMECARKQRQELLALSLLSS